MSSDSEETTAKQQKKKKMNTGRNEFLIGRDDELFHNLLDSIRHCCVFFVIY